jgi:hypothetical protein
MKAPTIDLPRLLSQIYPKADAARFFLQRAKIAPETLDLEGAPYVFWQRIVGQLYQERTLEDVVNLAAEEVPARAVDLLAAYERYHRQSATRVDSGVLQQPGLIRFAFDRCLPRLHAFLTKQGSLSSPAELPEFREYLRSLHASLLQEQRNKTYLPLAAKTAPSNPITDLQSDPFVSPVHQSILQLIGREQGGDAASAQIAAVNRQSRTVHNLLKAIERADEPLVLLGEPGGGKTLTLQNAVMAIASSEERRVFPRVPVYVRLGEFHVEGTPKDSDVLEFVKHSLPEAIAFRIEALDNTRRLILFFDGMDEMSRAQYTEHTEALSRFAHRRKCLFSCRIADFSPVFLHRRLVLLPFDRHRIAEYLGKYIAAFPIAIDGTEYSRRSLAARIARRDLPVEADNPFVLWLLCLFLQSRQVWPASRVELLGFYNQRNYERKQEELENTHEALPPFGHCEQGWAWLAHRVTQRNLGPAIPVSDLESPPWDEELLRAGKVCGILAESRDRGQHLVRFQHHRFQEYFTAVHLRNRGAELEGELDFDSPRWQETITNLLLMREADQVVRRLTASIAELTTELLSELANRSPSAGREVKLALADRVEFASRILRQRVSGSPAFDELSQQVRQTVPLLIDYGNPIAQVKMIRVCLNIPEIDWVQVLDKPLHSEIAWVRNQAIILLGSHRATARAIGADLASEIGLDLANSQFVHRVPAYLQAAKASGERRAWRPFTMGMIAFVLQFVLLAGLAMSSYVILWKVSSLGARTASVKSSTAAKPNLLTRALESPYWKRPLIPEWIRTRYNKTMTPDPASIPKVWDDFGILNRPFSFFLCLAATIAAGGIALARRPTAVWIAMMMTAFVTSLLIPAMFSLWSGSGVVFLLGLFWVGCLYFAYGVWSLAAYGIHAATVSLYVFGSRKDRRSGHSLSHFIRPVWSAGNYSKYLNETTSILRWGAVVFGCLALGMPLALWLTGVTGMPYHPVINVILILGPLAIILLMVRMRRHTGSMSRRDVILVIVTSLGVLVVVELLIYGIAYLLRWLAAQAFWIEVARTAVILALIALLIYLAKTTDFLWRLIARYRLRKFPPKRFTRETWTAAIQAADPVDQEVIILRTEPRSVGLDAPGYLKLLETIEPLIKQEPAQGTYWSQRDQLQEILRQERH